MKAKGVVRDVLDFRNSREYLFWRVKRRVAEQGLVKPLKRHLGHKAATAEVARLFGAAYDNDKAFLDKVPHPPLSPPLRRLTPSPVPASSLLPVHL